MLPAGVLALTLVLRAFLWTPGTPALRFFLVTLFVSYVITFVPAVTNVVRAPSFFYIDGHF